MPFIGHFTSQASYSKPRVTLGGSILGGGDEFEFVLVVVNFLGARSTPQAAAVRRAALPIPTITIEAPPLLLFGRSASVLLEARASLPVCFSETAVVFHWTLLSANAPLFPPNASAVAKRDLLVRGSQLIPGELYKLKVTGALDVKVAGSAVTTIGPRDEPLRAAIAGGDRTVGQVHRARDHGS